MLKVALLLALVANPDLPEQYCGVDVPYDVVVVGDVMAIMRANSREDCTLVGETATCPESKTLIVTQTVDGGIQIESPAISIPIKMPRCGPQT